MPPVRPDPRVDGFLPSPLAGSGSSSHRCGRALVLTATGAHIVGRRTPRARSAAPATSLTASGRRNRGSPSHATSSSAPGATAPGASGSPGPLLAPPTAAGPTSWTPPTPPTARRPRPTPPPPRQRPTPRPLRPRIRPRPTPPRKQKAPPPLRPRAGHREVGPADRRRHPLTSGFGMRWGRMHAGNDFAAPVGTPRRGDVDRHRDLRRRQAGYGNKVEIRYWDGTVSYFGHMDRVTATRGPEGRPGRARRLLRQHRPLDRPAPAPGDPPARPRARSTPRRGCGTTACVRRHRLPQHDERLDARRRRWRTGAVCAARASPAARSGAAAA